MNTNTREFKELITATIAGVCNCGFCVKSLDATVLFDAKHGPSASVSIKFEENLCIEEALTPTVAPPQKKETAK